MWWPLAVESTHAREKKILWKMTGHPSVIFKFIQSWENSYTATITPDHGRKTQNGRMQTNDVLESQVTQWVFSYKANE